MAKDMQDSTNLSERKIFATVQTSSEINGYTINDALMEVLIVTDAAMISHRLALAPNSGDVRETV